MDNEKNDLYLRQLIRKIKAEIKNENFLGNKKLIEICRDYLTGINKEKQNHRIHDLLETAVNILLFEKFAEKNGEDKFKKLLDLENLSERLPTQSWRDREQKEYQQFSTPPAVGFVMWHYLKPKENSIALEPSAGTGSLANWLKISGCRVEVNEISKRRRELLTLQGFNPRALNAEFLDDLLDPEIRPDFILMNPPFSASGGRTNGRNTDFGFRHVESALSRLNPGGRLVCLLGADSCLKTIKGKLFWERIGKDFQIRAFLIVPAKAFYKHGTTFQTVVIVIEKPDLNKIETPKTAGNPQKIEFCSLNEMMQFSDALN